MATKKVKADRCVTMLKALADEHRWEIVRTRLTDATTDAIFIFDTGSRLIVRTRSEDPGSTAQVADAELAPFRGRMAADAADVTTVRSPPSEAMTMQPDRAAPTSATAAAAPRR